MTGFVIFVLLIFSLNIWLAITALHAVITGVTCINGRACRRDKEPHEFWISVSSKAVAALVSFLYLVSVFARVLHYKPR